MDSKIYAEIRQLRINDKLGARKIARILMNNHPEKELTPSGWKSFVERYLYKEGLNNLETLSNIPKVDTEENENLSSNITNRSVERKADGSYVYESIIELFENEEVTPTRIMEAHKLNPYDWEVVSYKNNYWSQQTKGGKVVILYQSKLIVRPRKFDNISEDLVLEHFMEKSAECRKNIVPKNHSKNNNSLMLEVNICDLHLGKLAFSSTCGEEYNLEIAKQRFNDYIQKEYERAKEYKVEKILFVWSNDFFNTDGISYSTTGGTPQQSGMPWQQLFLDGCDLLVSAIDLLSTVAPVKSFYIASNHSRQADFYALCYLSAWFRADKSVEIIKNQKTRYYEQYGTVLLGFSHSYYEKEKNLYHLMSMECPEEWSETTYREFHLAHYHSEKVVDVGGVVYRWLPTMCGTDDYHFDKGYVGSVKRSYSFLYDKNVGLVQMNCNII